MVLKRVHDFSQFIKEDLQDTEDPQVDNPSSDNLPEEPEKPEKPEKPEQNFRLFCDMDGVLTDFNRGFKRLKANHDHLKPKEYEKIHGTNSIWPLIDHRKDRFWRRLPWKKDGRELWDYLNRYDPIILSSPSQSKYSVDGKLQWLKLNLGLTDRRLARTPDEFEDGYTRIVLSNKKEDFVRDKNDILIDDLESNIKKWTEAGGTGILHDDSTDTIKRVEEIIAKLRPSSDEEVNESTLAELKAKYPEAKFTLRKNEKFENAYFARLDLKTQGGKMVYLGALKGPVSKEDAISFFDMTLKKEYDKYY